MIRKLYIWKSLNKFSSHLLRLHINHKHSIFNSSACGQVKGWNEMKSLLLEVSARLGCQLTRQRGGWKEMNEKWMRWEWRNQWNEICGRGNPWKKLAQTTICPSWPSHGLTETSPLDPSSACRWMVNQTQYTGTILFYYSD